jgi:predicted AlkP superfamily pyrophosphatase or phosphodiesterase
MGHKFGVNSERIKDCYISLDEILGYFLKFLDKEIGKNEYLLFLTSDHGCAHNANFLQKHRINAGIFNDKEVLKNLNSYLEKKFKQKNIVLSLNNYQVNFNYPNITKIPHEKLITECIAFLENLPSVLYVVEQKKAAQAAIPQTIKESIINGYNREYSGEIQIILKPAYYHAKSELENTHGTLFPYDTHIPFILYGKGIKQGSSKKQIFITDIAAILANLLKLQMPNGCIGKPK